MSSSRPRRLLLALLALPVLFLFLLFLTSRRNIFATSASKPAKLPDEIFGLLHFVTSPDEAGRVINTVENAQDVNDGTGEAPLEDAITPEKPVPMAWYALGSIAKTGPYPLRGRSESTEWDDRLRTLRERYPLVVFSKTYCPYSKRAKRLLETYDLSPAPKIIEVDLRADASHIKTVLTRLTHRSTFPNVILHGRSLGGSDDMMELHEEDQLRPLLEQGGVKVGWTGEADGDTV